MLIEHPPRGFTLVEALVALALMLAGLAGAGIVLGRSIQYERESGTRRAVIRLAGSLAEELRALDRELADIDPGGRPGAARMDRDGRREPAGRQHGARRTRTRRPGAVPDHDRVAGCRRRACSGSCFR